MISRLTADLVVYQTMHFFLTYAVYLPGSVLLKQKLKGTKQLLCSKGKKWTLSLPVDLNPAGAMEGKNPAFQRPTSCLFYLENCFFFTFNLSQVVITLGIFSIQYPPLFGLCAMQLPMVSGLLNPLIYGITWTPYRRAYIQALKWPFAKCCNRRFKTSPRSRSHNLDCKYSQK